MLKIKIINQSDLTADCWTVQAWGLEACKTCEFQGTKDCGGGKTLEKLKGNGWNEENRLGQLEK
jgi:hypothetical protein